ncbi:hypothetical protein NDU88_003397 [Pleurodeles waltl]|uniref:Uncharacterized protein n=1 Tax=Pleurodeles waltl TaxID=8319 RepID=A0AAV7TNE7_PLEWA|nr:hypothetical protein NDU88_003397 [Pleurodeles waltl]
MLAEHAQETCVFPRLMAFGLFLRYDGPGRFSQVEHSVEAPEVKTVALVERDPRLDRVYNLSNGHATSVRQAHAKTLTSTCNNDIGL